MCLRGVISSLMISMVVIFQSYVWVASESLAVGDIAYPEVSGYFIGLGEDKVGSGFQSTPNGEPDGHFVLEVNTGGEFMEVVGIWMYTSDHRGNPIFTTQAGQKWSTTGEGWIIGVERNGQRLNPSRRNIEDTISGKVRYDLYADGARWFRKPGQHFTIGIMFSDGTTISLILRIGIQGPPLSPGGQ